MTFKPADHITNLRGKDYLEVKWRLVWFREDHPKGGISTEIVSTDPVLVRAVITSEDGQILATGHGSANDNGQNVVWKGKAIEKAETAAIGRALAHAGYGTQFAPDDDEDDVVDSPVQRKPAPSVGTPTPKPTTPPPAQNAANANVEASSAPADAYDWKMIWPKVRGLYKNGDHMQNSVNKLKADGAFKNCADEAAVIAVIVGHKNGQAEGQTA